MSSTTDPRNPQTNDPREAKFPPLSWLGWSLDMTSVTPSDISSVTASVLKASRLLNISKRRESQSFNSGVTWEVPENVDATDDVAEGGSSYYTFEDGTKAASSITGDASLSAKYMAVSGSGSANYSISKMFQASYSYALFSYNENLIQASIEGWADYINEEGLGKRLKNLPKWDPDNDDTVGKYRRFFRTEGTHVITGTSYGGRFQLTAWASNHNSEQKQSFGANVSVEYNGLTNGGRFNASVKGSSEYSEFSKSIQKIVSCKGGDPDLAGTIASSVEKDGIYGDFKAWVDTSRRNPAIMAMQTVSIWDMMSAAIDDRIVHRAAEVESAFKHIVRHPAKHVTKCRFVVNSDWGEIGLLTPAAFIRHDASSPALPEFSIATTKLSWGSEHSSEFRRDVTVDFEIINDGSPVDIMLSHGSDGATRGNGECAVTIYETRYANSGIKDNGWNSQWFYQCEVNPDEAS